MAESMPKPNRGMTLADTVAMGINQESQASWLAKRHISVESRIKLTRLSHMRYQHPDLDAIHQFMMDFGLQVALQTDDEVWYKGYGPDQYVYYAKKGPRKFLGGVFQAASWDDFERASKLSSAEPVEQLHDAPGGGFLVTVTDPEGFPVNVIYGQQLVADKPTYSPEKVVLNFPEEKPRVRQFNRFEPGPAAIYKLGHFGLCTQKFEEQLEFYTSNFNIVPTDFVYVEKEGHQVPAAHVHHSSYEVYDFDAQHLGHEWLVAKGYRPTWGIGRHVLGSQIFDYWWDISGNMVEHYADGDLVNNETPIGYMPAGEDTLAIWGPKVPRNFME
ncbi:Glyoxalase/Bleomycin resistance protein/Dihydroxybiphenyl dioxygenase [Aspergillus caelatus]|uniref:Glyoxalase/Bleomycin resistance protein/Dihydroxybiphenyl dioxygenase n=1 Tax=Aspergillus caelatus TaxID=61420 RepID=A0A5N6ZY75_9EURO|nr:Glyoxalase/Bleomycin resistance protein/Dihydroxybiphenyl dioxygenase [Aspergillus caelatus]KAE8361869.1 Glyoxalase/Bleomycin resistance protein/Dihydroxybiphenyl dioxygenase [Aspergillus caelatus]